jgi:Tol biopolymer transport system component
LNPEFSADGKQVALERLTDNNRDIWILELARGVFTRFTSEPGTELKPIWSPDGSRIVYADNNANSLVMKSVTGADKKETIFSEKTLGLFPADWSPDGKTILFEADHSGPSNIWVLSLDDRKAHVLAESRFAETEARFSPNGKWIVYTSNESGRYEVYARSFPSNENKIQISTNGGAKGRWRHDGKEIFYMANDDRLMAVSVTGDTRLEAKPPEPLFASPEFIGNFVRRDWRQPYDVTADGQRFLVLINVKPQTPPPVTILLNWQTQAHR